jgi:hypothetical protein
MSGVRGTPPSSSLYSSSPTTGIHGIPGSQMYPIGYQPPQMIPNLASALSQMSIGQQQSSNNRRDSFNSSSNAGMNINYPHPGPQQSQPYYVMTPPGGRISNLGQYQNHIGYKY